MRIACIVTTLAMGGAERLAVDLAERMASDGHSVLLLSLAPEQVEEWPTHLKVVRLGISRNPLRCVAGLWRAYGELRSFAPDLLHSHCFHANLVARLMRLAGIRARVLSTVHNVYEGPWHRLMAYRLTDRWADGVAFVCQSAADRYAQLGVVRADSVHVMPNGVDTTVYEPDPERRAQTRKTMDSGDCFVWLSAGRLTSAKDIPNLLRAFAHLLEQRGDAELWIAGEDRDGDRAELEEMAAALGIAYAVCWLGLRRDLPALLDACDGFVLASAWEGMPLVLAEAMAMERPVVATNVGGVSEVAGEAAWLVSARDSAGLANAMLEVMRLPEAEIQARTGAGRQRIVTSFSLQACAERWQALYAQLLESHR